MGEYANVTCDRGISEEGINGRTVPIIEPRQVLKVSRWAPSTAPSVPRGRVWEHTPFPGISLASWACCNQLRPGCISVYEMAAFRHKL